MEYKDRFEGNTLGEFRKNSEGYFVFHTPEGVSLTCRQLKEIMEQLSDLNSEEKICQQQ